MGPHSSEIQTNNLIKCNVSHWFFLCFSITHLQILVQS